MFEIIRMKNVKTVLAISTVILVVFFRQTIPICNILMSKTNSFYITVPLIDNEVGIKIFLQGCSKLQFFDYY